MVAACPYCGSEQVRTSFSGAHRLGLLRYLLNALRCYCCQRIFWVAARWIGGPRVEPGRPADRAEPDFENGSGGTHAGCHPLRAFDAWGSDQLGYHLPRAAPRPSRRVPRRRPCGAAGLAGPTKRTVEAALASLRNPGQVARGEPVGIEVLNRN